MSEGVFVKIHKVEEAGVWVTPEAHTSCQSCAQASFCSGSVKSKTKLAKPIFVSDTSAQYAKNDTARLCISNRKLTQASLLVYGLPLSLMLLAALFSQPLQNEVLSLVFMLIGLGSGFVISSFLQIFWLKKPEITLK